MNKKEIVRKISDRTGIKESIINLILKQFFEVVSTSLIEHRRVIIRNFGEFNVKLRKAKRAYKCIGPSKIDTSSPQWLPDRNEPVCTFSKSLKRKVR